MFLKKSLIVFCFLLTTFISKAQIEVVHVTVKDFKSTGFGGFLNFSLPVSEANAVTIEGGFQYFSNSDEEDLSLIPILLGYRYTLNQTGTGFYVEPNAGYCSATSTIGKYTENGSPITDGNGGYAYEKVSGPMAGVGIGYLFEPGGRIQFNTALRYERTFGSAGVNMFSFRISHAFSFRKRDNY